MTTTTYHPPIYYSVRTVVRWVFWSLAMWGLLLTLSWVSNLGDKPECPITLNDDFTYTANKTFVLGECYAGHNITLNGNNTWEWTQ